MQKAHMLWKVLRGLFLVTNIEWGKPRAHVTCSYIDLSGYVSGPIRRC